MPRQFGAERFGFGEVSGRAVIARVDWVAILSDGSTPPLGLTDRVIRLIGRFVVSFTD